MKFRPSLPGFGDARHHGRLASTTAALAIAALLLAPGAVLANDAHLTIVKTFDSPTATAGATIGFTVTVQIHLDGSQDPLCVVVTPVTVQCAAHNVVLSDQLPTSPAGLHWTVDAAHSNPGCDVDVTRPGYLTCQWGDLVAKEESRTVHVISTTVPGLNGTCGTVVNAVAEVVYNWTDGTKLEAQATNAQMVLSCTSVTPPPTPKPTPSGSVQGATSPPQPHVTLPPTDAGISGSTGRTGNDFGLMLAILLATAAAAAVALGRRPLRR